MHLRGSGGGPARHAASCQSLSARAARPVARGVPWHTDSRQGLGQVKHPPPRIPSLVRRHRGGSAVGAPQLVEADKPPGPLPQDCPTSLVLTATGQASAWPTPPSLQGGGTLPCQGKTGTPPVTLGTTEGHRRSHSVQHGIQLVSQGVEHGADVVQDVFGGGARGALTLLRANALLCGPQCCRQGRAGLLQPLLGLAWACSPGVLRPGRGYRAGAEPGSQLRTRKSQLCAGHRHRLGGGSCSGHLQESRGRSWGLSLPIPPTACGVFQTGSRA